MNKRNKILITTLLVIFCGSLSAQIVTDRPDQTESAQTIPKGSLQLESGVLIGYEGNRQQNSRQLLLPTNLFRYGITNLVELRLLNQLEVLTSNGQQVEGVSDIEIGTKIQLLKKENLNTEIAFLTHLIVPTGTRGLSSGKYGTSNKLSISHKIKETLEMGYNVGYNYLGEGNGDLIYSLAFGIGISEKMGIYAEPFGSVINMSKFIASFDAGVTYLMRENIQFDFSFGIGLNHKMNYISIGCSWVTRKK